MADTPRPSEEDLDRVIESLDSLTYYQLLGLSETAAITEVRAAFHEFSRRFHPDTQTDASADFREKARRVFARGAEAYAVLKTPKRRSEYDLATAQGQRRLNERADGDATASTGPVPSQRRALEDVCETKGAKLHARQAARALSDGNMKEAASLLRKAVFTEPKNRELAERLKSIEDFIKMGAG
jgi:curved DNA-binding protein CbpA